MLRRPSGSGLQEESMEMVLYLRLEKAAAAVAEPVFIFVFKTTAICAGGTLKKDSEDPISQKKFLLGFLVSRDIEMDIKIR